MKKKYMNSLYFALQKEVLTLVFAAFVLLPAAAQVIQPSAAAGPPREEDFFRIVTVNSPQGILLEVGGLTSLPNGDLGVSTRRGDIYVVENPGSARPYFRKFATGLHEVLGLAYKDGAFYCVQRGELTKLQDTNMDGKADLYETVFSWPLTGNYHEYSYGPKIAPDGSFFVTANVGFFDDESFRGRSSVPWRGWAMHIFPDGRMEPWATGFRSPAGPGMIDGQLFYTDNQGDWIGSGALWQVAKGDFLGNPAGLNWTRLPGSPLKLTPEQLFSKIDPRQSKDANGRFIQPKNIENEKFTTIFEMKKQVPELRLPAAWLPYGFLGVSTSEPVSIPEGNFGPFAGQVLVGDQGMSMISRVFLEKVNGEYQGASFIFRTGFNAGVFRLEWAKDGSLFVGETSRGWGSSGDANEGLQRLVWNNVVPFEMRAVRAMPDGFEIEFTKPVDIETAENLASYSVESFIYKYHPVYGSPPVNQMTCKVRGVKVSADGLKARIIVDNLRQSYIHTITLDGVFEKGTKNSPLHPIAYYTLNNIPAGPKLSINEVSTKNVAAATVPVVAGGPTNTAKAAYDAVKGLLIGYTCTSCHNPVTKVVGPSFTDIANKKYSNEKIVELIHNPQPQNWPDFPTPMTPMPQVSTADGLKIAAWITSLAK